MIFKTGIDMSKQSVFTNDFVAAVTGFQQRYLRHGYVTDINLGADTMRVQGSVANTLSSFFPHMLSKPVPLTALEGPGIKDEFIVMPDLQLHQKDGTPLSSCAPRQACRPSVS